MQLVSGLFPGHLPERMKDYRDKFEHHLMLKMSGSGIKEARTYLGSVFPSNQGAFFECRGRARLATNPAPTGSTTFANTIGIVFAAGRAFGEGDFDFERLPMHAYSLTQKALGVNLIQSPFAFVALRPPWRKHRAVAKCSSWSSV